MFGIGGFELFLIILFAFLIFGPDKLPAVANTVGKAIAKFKNAKDEMTGTLNAKSFLSDDPDQPIKNPIEVLEQAAATVEAKRNKKDSQQKKPGSAIENYPTFAERKAAYEKEQAAKEATKESAAKKATKESVAKDQANKEQATKESSAKERATKEPSAETPNGKETLAKDSAADSNKEAE